MAREKEQDERNIDDIVGDLRYGDPFPREEEGEETTDKGSATESDTESTEAEEPEVESEPDTERDAAPEGDEGEPEESQTGESEEGSDDGEATEDKDAESEADDEPLIEIDGEEVPLSEVRKWREGNLRHSDYTRKTQELAAERKALEEKSAEQNELLDDIFADDAMSAFVKTHPKVLKQLIADPKNTREVLGNTEEVQRLWDDYELLMERPHLANRVFGDEGVDEEAVQNERLGENMVLIGNALDAKVDELAGEYDGVDPDEVRSQVLSLARIPTGENVDPNEVIEGFERAYNLFFLQDQESGGVTVDPTLIKNQFELLARSSKVGKSQADAEADEHNRQVDEQLKDQSSAPATSGGEGPAPTPEPLDDGKSLNERIASLRGIE